MPMPRACTSNETKPIFNQRFPHPAAAAACSGKRARESATKTSKIGQALKSARDHPGEIGFELELAGTVSSECVQRGPDLEPGPRRRWRRRRLDGLSSDNFATWQRGAQRITADREWPPFPGLPCSATFRLILVCHLSL